MVSTATNDDGESAENRRMITIEMWHLVFTAKKVMNGHRAEKRIFITFSLYIHLEMCCRQRENCIPIKFHEDDAQ